MIERKKAVVLLSGGVDSATVMGIAKHEGFEIHCLSFFYGQRHSIELSAAKRIADTIGAAKHLITNIDLANIGHSALTDNIDVPKNRNIRNVAKEIPVTYVPARNTIFLSYALALAEVIGSSDIFIGVNAIDYSGYPDCRPEYIAAFEHMANLATKAGVEGITKIKIRAPLINMTKAEIIKKGIELGVDYSLTHSCYDPSPGNLACGRCDSCLLRKQGFKEAGIMDPTKYGNYSGG
ncbi:MAG: 7-cyano-7-deazaguanine synthase [Desulfobacteraceae bacterium Eth-SRB1]|nr:MAG: 7-cyano-7-deazaguanine synthase [Desulfobacteraceae bacterium Eth-SRB1]